MLFIDNKQLVSIGVERFYEGMYINTSIYYEYQGSCILICKDIVLSKELLAKLQKTTRYGRLIYVEAGYEEPILEQSKQFEMVHQQLEFNIGHIRLKETAENLLDTVTKTNKISSEVADTVTETISEKIAVLDSSLILQCINGERNVDEYLYVHSVNVAFLNGLIGKWLKLSQSDIDAIVKVGLLHDIGKVKIADEVINKPAILTPTEFEIMKGHANFSYEILKNSGETNELILRGVREHHEKVNGTGYPDSLHIDDICLYARITSISDVYDAMVAKRVYKDRHSPFEILAEFAMGRFSNLDIEIVNIFLKNMPSELIGKPVLLSNGEIATVLHVNPSKYAFPIVKLDKQVILTNDKIKCIAMCDVV